ncbi:hypothetical protein Tco_0605589 [Tanacetum coccineum]
MASHHSKSLYAIKECSTCGRLYTKECCSIGSLDDKILVPEPDSFFDLLAYCIENGIFQDFQDTSESSDDNTNVVNALREPFVVNQDPGVKSSQDPPQIDHNCCYECGDSSDGIFCRQCICKSCGKGAHYGYNCPPKVPIISNPEQCNQTINELPQILPIVHPTCNYEAENSFTYDPNPNSFDNSPNCSYPPPQPQFETYLCELCRNNAHYGYDCPPQFPFVYEQEPAFLKEYDHIPPNEKCMALLLAEERFFKIKLTMREEQNQPEVMQELLLKLINDLQILKGIQQEKKKPTIQSSNPYWNSSMIDDKEARDNFLKDVCTFLRKFSRIPFGVTPKVILIAWERFGEIKDALMDKQYRQEDIQELMRKLLEDVRNISEELSEYINCPSWNRPLFYFDDDNDEYTVIWRKPKEITPDLPIEEPDNSLNMGDEHLDTIPATESDEVIKSSVENLVPIPSEFEGISDDTCDVPNCDDTRVNVESELVESLINRDTSIVYSSKIDPILEEFASELAHIALISLEIIEANFDPNDDTSSDDDSFENIEYVDASPSYIEYDSFEEVNDVEQEEKEFDLENNFQIQDIILREKLLNVHRLISNIESLKVNPTPDHVLKSPSFPIPVVDSDAFFEESDTSFSHLDNSLPEFETFSDHTEETRSGKFPEFESFHSDFYDNPSFPRPPPEPPDVEICLNFEPDAPMIKNFDELNEDECFNPMGGKINVEVSFTFVTWIFLPYLTYPEVSPLHSSTKSEDTIYDPGIST